MQKYGAGAPADAQTVCGKTNFARHKFFNINELSFLLTPINDILEEVLFMQKLKNKTVTLISFSAYTSNMTQPEVIYAKDTGNADALNL